MSSKRGEIIKEILVGIGVLGLIVIGGAIAPNIFGILSKNGFTKRKYGKKFTRTIHYLRERELIKTKENPDGTFRNFGWINQNCPLINELGQPIPQGQLGGLPQPLVIKPDKWLEYAQADPARLQHGHTTFWLGRRTRPFLRAGR